MHADLNLTLRIFLWCYLWLLCKYSSWLLWLLCKNYCSF